MKKKNTIFVSDNANSIKEFILDEISNLNIKENAVATKAQMTPQVFSAIKHGHRGASLERLKRLAAAIGYSIEISLIKD